VDPVRSPKSVPLHLRLVLVNGLVFALGVLAMSMAPEDHRGPAALAVLAVGLTLILAVNTRHLRRSLTPLMTTIGTLRSRWENERRAQTARSMVSKEYDGQQMSTELHDNVGDNLAAALVGLKKAIDHAPPELAVELRSVQQRARLSLVEVRKIGRRLRPEILEDQGLHSALSTLASNVSVRNPGIRVRSHLEGPFPGLDGDAELVVYRVAEEALTNIARHANAQRVDLRLTREPGLVVLIVTDDGVGVGHNGERTGILGMRERAARVGGHLSIRARAGGGTEVRLELPAPPHSS
jgi:two-component system, NarL family, sensor histidine kinase UhpB